MYTTPLYALSKQARRCEVISGAPSEYEVQRLHNIAQNKQKLQMLGLEDSAPAEQRNRWRYTVLSKVLYMSRRGITILEV